MSNKAIEKSVTPKQGFTPLNKWTAGLFSTSIIQLPEACLIHCLNGNEKLAETQGCALIKQLLRHNNSSNLRRNMQNTQKQDMQAVCGQGYAVKLFMSECKDNPDVLILHPPHANKDHADIVSAAADSLRNALCETWKLNEENNGLAEEVLRNYEQINLIFDISAQIATLTESYEVRHTLLAKLRHLFNADSVFLISVDERTIIKVTKYGGYTHRRGGKIRPLAIELTESEDSATGNIVHQESGYQIESIKLPPEYERVKKQLQKSQRVIVSSTDPAYEKTGHGTSVWGPLKEGDGQFAVVGLTRRQLPFVAGDMLLLDSVLTFGSYILSNLQLIDQVKRTSFEAVRALVNAIDQKDNYTCGHAERVGFLAKAVGEHMHLSPLELQTLEWAGLLHDVGKIGIPETVLNKPGRLSPEEYTLIQQHSSRGYEVLKPVASLEPVLEAVLRHHECPDGSGYPDGLKSAEIPLAARIIHVVDVFDALTSTRSYRQAYDFDHAIKILTEDAGTKLDSEIVDNFLEMWDRLPTLYPKQYERWFGMVHIRMVHIGMAKETVS